MDCVYAPMDSSTQVCEETLCPVVIKNTFITLSYPEAYSRPVCRRASSAPATPTTRSSNYGDGEFKDMLDLGQRQMTNPSHSLNDCVCEGGDADAQSPAKFSPAGSDGAGSTASTAPFEAGEFLEGYLTSDEDEGISRTASSSQISPELCGVCSSGTTPLRAALKSTARSFEPTPVAIQISPVAVAISMPPEARRSFAEVVAAGLQALRSSEHVESAEVQEVGNGWSLTCAVLPSNMQHFQETVDLVGKALLEAAEGSENVYVVGYEKMPFIGFVDRQGFSAQLALVRDEAAACWDLLAGGYCRRGTACRWQHPSWQVNIEVTADFSWPH